MAVRLLAVILLAIIVIGLPTWAIIRLMQRHRFQFSLKTLLIFVTAVAVLLSAITSWNRWFKAQIEFLHPSSPLVAQWKKPPEIVEENGQFKVIYRLQHRGIGEVLNLTEKAFQGQPISSSRATFDHEGQSMTYESDDRPYLEKRLSTIQKFDVLQKGCFTIQGIVQDAAGNPVSGATVDLMGSYVYINHFATRKDGTFLMPMQAPAQSGYYLRIRYGNKSMDTTTFSLDAVKSEMFVIVRVK
jgi:hypothetical protein